MKQSFDEVRIKALIENKIAENKVLEYKQSVQLAKDEQTKEFLFDVSSFANSAGGAIIIGIKEDKGEPLEITGVVGDCDAEILRIESCVRSSISPRIAGFYAYAVIIDVIKSVIVIEIPRSWSAPHQVTYKGTDKFYSRSSNGKYRLDVAELRSAFLQSEALTQQVRAFKRERISIILSGETYVNLGMYGSITLHAMPLRAFGLNAEQGIELTKLSHSQMKPISARKSVCEFNFDGVIAKSNTGAVGDEYNGYIQVFRNGIIETTNSHLLRPYDGQILLPMLSGQGYGINFEQDVIRAVEECIELFNYLNISPPYVFFVSLIKVKNYGLDLGNKNNFARAPLVKLDRDVLQLPELLVEEEVVDVCSALKPMFDTIWNAFGFPCSQSYNENGIWAPKMQ